MSLNYVFENIAASTRIMLGNPQGLAQLDRSTSGFWRSFYALVLTVPFTFGAKKSEYYQLLEHNKFEQPVSLFGFIAVQEITSIVAYMVSLIALYAITVSTGSQSRLVQCVVAMNWSSLALAIISFPVVVFVNQVSGASPAQQNPMLTILVLALMVIFILAMFRIMRISLQISRESAVVYVFVISTFELITYFFLLNLVGY